MHASNASLYPKRRYHWRSMTTTIGDKALALLFTNPRSHNGWNGEPVGDTTLVELYDLVKMAPTSANCSPGRFAFLRTSEGKELLQPAISSGIVEKTMSTPVTVIAVTDREFYEKLPQLFPHADARSWFTSSQNIAEERVSQLNPAGWIPHFGRQSVRLGYGRDVRV